MLPEIKEPLRSAAADPVFAGSSQGILIAGYRMRMQGRGEVAGAIRFTELHLAGSREGALTFLSAPVEKTE